MESVSKLGWDAVNAISAAVAAIGTLLAVAIALWQSATARREALSEQRYRNWLEQKRLEEQHLGKMLEVVNHPLNLAQRFFFEATRLLARMPANIAPRLEDARELEHLMNGFMRDSEIYQSAISAYIDIVAALREHHARRGDKAEAQEFGELLQLVNEAFDASNDLQTLLADEASIRAIEPDAFYDAPAVATARNKTYRAARALAKRLVTLYDWEKHQLTA